MSKPDFWWFEGESVRTIAKQLLRLGTDNVRFKVIPDGDKVLLQVTGKPSADDSASVEAVFPPVNESHPCPPDC